MNYVIYLYALAAGAVAGVCFVVFLLLPTAGVYYLTTKCCKQRKWVGIVTSVLFGVFGGGYLYTGHPNELWSYGEEAYEYVMDKQNNYYAPLIEKWGSVAVG